MIVDHIRSWHIGSYSTLVHEIQNMLNYVDSARHIVDCIPGELANTLPSIFTPLHFYTFKTLEHFPLEVARGF